MSSFGTFGVVRGAYGCDSGFGCGTSAFGGSESLTDWAELVAVVRTIQDPYKKVEVLNSRIATAKRLGAPRWVVSDLEAQLRAAKRAVAEDKQGKQYTEEWRGLGQTSVVLTQALLVALTITAVAGTYSLLKRS